MSDSNKKVNASEQQKPREELLEVAAEVMRGERPESDLEENGISLEETIEGDEARDMLLKELEALENEENDNSN